ncbi:MAG: MFS transporter [Acidimicrobiaceae bacterium]|nr:MFS transporter [Acidimicrobiaceae bacterium]
MSRKVGGSSSRLDRSEMKVVSVMTAAHGIQHFYVSGIALTYPFVLKEFHSSYAYLGVLLGVSGVIGGLLQGAAGLVKNRQARSVLALQDVGLALAAALGAISPGMTGYASARVLGSIVQWPQHPVGSAYLSDRFPSRRGTVLSWHTTGGSLGTLLIPLAMTYAIASLGWRPALALLGLVLLIGALLVRIALPEQELSSRTERTHIGTKLSPEYGLNLLRNSWASIQTSSSSTKKVLAASTIAAAGRGLGVVAAFVPVYLHNARHLSLYNTGIIYTTMLFGGVVGPLYAGWLSDRIGRKMVLFSSYILGAASFVGLGFSPSNIPAIAVWSLAVGVLAYAENPLMQSMFADTVGEAQANTAFGVYFAIAYGVGAAWLIVLGWVIQRYGFPTFFISIAASFVVAGLIILTVPGDSKGLNRAGQPDR